MSRSTTCWTFAPERTRTRPAAAPYTGGLCARQGPKSCFRVHLYTNALRINATPKYKSAISSVDRRSWKRTPYAPSSRGRVSMHEAFEDFFEFLEAQSCERLRLD
jgi:hypothetical protein